MLTKSTKNDSFRFTDNLTMCGLDGNPRAGATFVPHPCVFPAEPRLFVSIYLNVGDEQEPVTGVVLLTCRIRDLYWWTCLCCCEPRGDVNCVCLFLWGWLFFVQKKKEKRQEKRREKKKKERKKCPSCLGGSLKNKQGARGWNCIFYLIWLLSLYIFFQFCLFLFCWLIQDKQHTALPPSCYSSILFYPIHPSVFPSFLLLTSPPPSLPPSPTVCLVSSSLSTSCAPSSSTLIAPSFPSSISLFFSSPLFICATQMFCMWLSNNARLKSCL